MNMKNTVMAVMVAMAAIVPACTKKVEKNAGKYTVKTHWVVCVEGKNTYYCVNEPIFDASKRIKVWHPEDSSLRREGCISWSWEYAETDGFKNGSYKSCDTLSDWSLKDVFPIVEIFKKDTIFDLRCM